MNCNVVIDTIIYDEPLSYEIEEYDSTHNYTDNGICKECYHINTCNHTNLDNEVQFFTSYIDTDDDIYHTVYYHADDNAPVKYCNECGMAVQIKYQPGVYKFKHHYLYSGMCKECGHIKNIEDIDINEYNIILDKVTMTNATSGYGILDSSGIFDESALLDYDYSLWARVTWVYTLSNGDSFAYCAMKQIDMESYQFNMVSPKAPYGATLDSVQVALVADPNADSSGTYTALTTARK